MKSLTLKECIELRAQVLGTLDQLNKALDQVPSIEGALTQSGIVITNSMGETAPMTDIEYLEGAYAHLTVKISAMRKDEDMAIIRPKKDEPKNQDTTQPTTRMGRWLGRIITKAEGVIA